MDTFVEQIIVKKKGPKEIAIITGTILLVVILVFVLFLFLNYFSLVIDMLSHLRGLVAHHRPECRI